MKRRLRSSSRDSPPQESTPRNKKILIKSPSSSSSSSMKDHNNLSKKQKKDPNTVSPLPAKIHHSDQQLQPVRLIPDSSSFTTPASPSLQVSPSLPCTSNSFPSPENNETNISNVNSLAKTSPVNKSSSLPFKRPLPFKRRCNSVTLTSSSENNEININHVNSWVSNSPVSSCFNSKSSQLPFKRQHNSIPLTTSSENSSSEINNNVNSNHNPQPHPPPPPPPNPHHPQPAPNPQHPPPNPHHPQPAPNPQHPPPNHHPQPAPNPQHPPPHPPPYHPPAPDPHPELPPFPPLPPLPDDAPPQPLIWRICCVGATRIGTVTMMMIANFCPNVDITIVDLNLNVIQNAIQGQFSFYEPHIQQLNNHLIGLNPPRLTFSPDIEVSIVNADIIFIATEIRSKTKPAAKKGQVEGTEWVNLWKYLVNMPNVLAKIIVDLTTLPMNFQKIFRRAIGMDISTFRVVFSPSFISEGTAIHDIHNPSRLVIATENIPAAHAILNLYQQWVPIPPIYVFPNLESAVLGKLGLNSILASRVVFINILNHMAKEWGAKRYFSRLITGDYRIENEYLHPSVGFGGSGLEKSLDFMSGAAHEKELVDESRLFKELIKINELARKCFVKEVEFDMGYFEDKRIAVLGFAFKKNTNNFANSPTIGICLELLKEERTQIQIYDPIVPAPVTRRFFNYYPVMGLMLYAY